MVWRAYMITVLIVDSSSYIRVKIRTALESVADIKVAGIARDIDEAVEKNALLKPDIITVDVNTSGSTGAESIERILKVNNVPIIVISSLTKEGSRGTVESLVEGAFDFICRDQIADQILVQKVRMAAL